MASRCSLFAVILLPMKNICKLVHINGLSIPPTFFQPRVPRLLYPWYIWPTKKHWITEKIIGYDGRIQVRSLSLGLPLTKILTLNEINISIWSVYRCEKWSTNNTVLDCDLVRNEPRSCCQSCLELLCLQAVSWFIDILLAFIVYNIAACTNLIFSGSDSQRSHCSWNLIRAPWFFVLILRPVL